MKHNFMYLLCNVFYNNNLLNLRKANHTVIRIHLRWRGSFLPLTLYISIKLDSIVFYRAKLPPPVLNVEGPCLKSAIKADNLSS